MSLRSFAERIPERVANSKAELPLLKLGRFGDDRTRKGSLRHNANMIAIEGVEGDYDDGKLPVAWALAKLDDAGIAAVVYESPSHRPEAPRWRVLCPTSRSLDPDERERLMARLNGVLDGVLARESFTLSQTYFYGRIEGRAAPRVEIVEGRAIDLANHLDRRALDKRGQPYGRPAANDDGNDHHGLEREPDVERIRDALDVLPSDALEQYHDWLEIGQALHHEFGGDPEGLELWDAASQWCETYDADELEAKWDSFGSYRGKPVTIGTLYRLAKKHAPKRKREFGGLTFETPADCVSAPPRGYVVKGLIAPRDVVCIFGAPGAGKSMLAPHIGYMVAQGETAFGMRSKPGTVLYVTPEDLGGMRQRVRALLERHGDAPNFIVVGGVSDLLDEDSDDSAALMEAVAEMKPSLIFIDTLAVGFPGLEENDSKSMGRVVAISKELTGHGAAVVLIHHDTKAEGSTPRGHSILNAALDMAIHVKRDEDGVVRGKLTKNRNGTTDRDIAFRIAVETLDTDEDGDPITGGLVEELTGGQAARAPKMTRSARAALETLEALEAEGIVSNEKWAEVASEGFDVSQSENLKSRQKAFQRARSELLRLGLITFNKRGNVRTAMPAEAEDDTCDI